MQQILSRNKEYNDMINDIGNAIGILKGYGAITDADELAIYVHFTPILQKIIVNVLKKELSAEEKEKMKEMFPKS